MSSFLGLLGPVLAVLLVADGIAFMFGRRFPVTRWAFRTVRRLVGGAFVSTGRLISGQRDNRRNDGGGNR